jgi:hypothetical protein
MRSMSFSFTGRIEFLKRTTHKTGRRKPFERTWNLLLKYDTLIRYFTQ